MGSLTAGQLIYQHFLLGLHLHQTFQLHVVPLQFGLLLVQIIVQLHHLSLTVLCLAFPLVPLPESPKLLLLDFDCEFVETFCEGRHVLIERDDFGDELHGETFEVVGLSEFFWVKDTNVVFLVKRDR